MEIWNLVRVRAALAAWLLVVASLATIAIACGDDDDDDGNGEDTAIENVIKASVQAENDGDAEAFVALWTDEGLEQYDVGTREELLSGEAPLGEEDEVVVVGFPDVTIDGTTATAIVDAEVGIVIYRVSFALIQQDGDWLLNGFEFLGGPPPPSGATVIDVELLDYAYNLSSNDWSGNVALSLENTGEEFHEVVLVRVPDGTSLDEAAETILESDPEDPPPGYELIGFLGFVAPGESSSAVFARELDGGSYVIVCFIPVGGFESDGPPHVVEGMIADITVN